MWTTISSIITLAAVVVVAQPAAAERPSFNPPVGAIFSEHGSDGTVPAEPLTNGKRFAVGLPPLPPKPRHHGRNSARGTSQAALWLSADSFRVAVGSKVDSARRAVASPSLPVTATCLLEAVDKSSGASYGYVTTDYNMGFATISTTGNFRWLSFTYTPTDPASLSGLNVRSGTNDHPYFGLTMSYYSSNNDLSAGNANYAWFSTTDLTGKTPTVTGNSPQDAQGAEQASESPLWEYNPVTGAMTPTWYNTDGSPVTTVPVRVGSDLYATGNYALLATRLGRPDMNAINFRAVQCRYT